MHLNFNKQERIWLILTYLFIVYGIFLRLKQFFFFRSFWLDEAGIAINILRKDFSELAKPLDYNQAAPYGFLILEKIFVILFGGEDFVFRIIPFFSGIILIFLFYHLLRNVFSNNLGILSGIALISLNHDVVYYTIELKPYISDALVATLLTIFFIRLVNNFNNNIIKYSFLSAIILWFSYPSLFFIASIYSALIIIFLREKDYQKLKKLILTSLIPLVSFSVYFLIVLKYAGKNDYLNNFWADHFAPAPYTLKALSWYKRAFLWALDKPYNISNVYLGTFFTFTGLFILFKKDKKLFLFIFLVTFFMLFTSMIKRYPVFQRLILFSVPLYYLIISYNFELFDKKISKIIIFSIFSVFFLFEPLKNSAEILNQSMSRQEIKPALRFISEKKINGDLLAIHHSADTLYEFYKDKYNLDGLEIIRKIKPMWNQAEYKFTLEKIKQSKRVWLLFTDFRRQENELFLGYLNSIGIKRGEWFYPGVELYLYEIRAPENNGGSR
ncbi:MAG: glycosyltransferase family 39 protein [Proteobacteria bacterium]|nr:glycosyltransferase family 39 protein [Pseudomonadota bacterium]